MPRIVQFDGTEVAKPIPSYQVYKGTVFELVDQAVDFVLSKINRSIGTRKESARAPRTYEIPEEVVTEAIVQRSGAPRLYGQRERAGHALCGSVGGLESRQATAAIDIREVAGRTHVGTWQSSAGRIYVPCREYIERMGTGTLDMIRRCVKAGLPEPVFAVPQGFVTKIWRATLASRAASKGAK